MRIKKVLISDILAYLGENVLRVEGLQDGGYIDNLADVDNINETSLDWVNPSKINKFEIAYSSKAKVLLVDNEIPAIQGKTLIRVKNPKVSLASIGIHFFMDRITPSIHPTAIIDPSAVIGDGVYIGPNCVIGKSTIGDNSVIDSNVIIYDDVIIGHHCKIKAGAILGGEGFGFEHDSAGNLFRFPQIGSLIIGNYVEIGGNTTIDRGALSDTIIGDYTKINNLCHIAHNNKIGTNVAIAGCANISGSNIIEDDVWISPHASVRGWLTVGKGATIGMGAVVVKNIPAGETWVGNPAHKLLKK